METISITEKMLGKQVVFELEKHDRWAIKGVHVDGVPTKGDSEGSYATKEEAVDAARAIAEDIMKSSN